MVSGASDLANYPLTVTLTDADLKTAANGGLVNNNSGYDIGFGPDCSGSGGMLKWEMESYSPVAGAIVAHVLRPALSSTTDDTIGMYYGAAYTSFQSAPSAVWDTHYKGVWHFPDGTTLTVNDSTGNTNNGAIVGAVTATAGQVAGAANNLTAGSNGIRVADAASLRIASRLTISYWLKQSVRNSNGSIVIQKRDPLNPASGYNYGSYLDSAGVLSFQFNDGSYRTFSDSGGTIPVNTWTYCTVVVDETAGTKLTFYRNGVPSSTPAYSGALPNSGTSALQITNYDQFLGGVFPIDGALDEVRLSDTARSSDWILTEYRNQSTPGLYITVGPRLGATRVRHRAIAD